MPYDIEIRWHGRGGHGLVSASNLLSEMVVRKGYYAISIPLFGAERRGAPTKVYTRISDRPILKRSTVLNPDIVIITDHTLFYILNPIEGLKENGYIILNANEMPDDISPLLKNYKTITLNAVDIAIKSDLRVGGIPVVTIPLLGALLKVLKIVDIKTATDVIRSRWEPDVANKNIKALEEAMGVVKIE